MQMFLVIAFRIFCDKITNIICYQLLYAATFFLSAKKIPSWHLIRGLTKYIHKVG